VNFQIDGVSPGQVKLVVLKEKPTYWILQSAENVNNRTVRSFRLTGRLAVSVSRHGNH
jgi:hypothetical protein